MILRRILFVMLLLCCVERGGFAKTPSPVSKFPDLNHLVIMIKGGALVPFKYSTNPIQWVGYLQGSYGVTPICAIEVDFGVGSKNYRLSGNALTDSIDALKNERMIYTGISVRWKAIRLNDNVNGVFLIGGHYVYQDGGFDMGFQLESRTGKLGLIFGITLAVQISRTSNLVPMHLNLGVDYSFTKNIAVALVSDLGFTGGRFSVQLGMMYSL